jgi:hypothetical protein
MRMYTDNSQEDLPQSGGTQPLWRQATGPNGEPTLLSFILCALEAHVRSWFEPGWHGCLNIGCDSIMCLLVMGIIQIFVVYARQKLLSFWSFADKKRGSDDLYRPIRARPGIVRAVALRDPPPAFPGDEGVYRFGPGSPPRRQGPVAIPLPPPQSPSTQPRSTVHRSRGRSSLEQWDLFDTK